MLAGLSERVEKGAKSQKLVARGTRPEMQGWPSLEEGTLDMRVTRNPKASPNCPVSGQATSPNQLLPLPRILESGWVLGFVQWDGLGMRAFSGSGGRPWFYPASDCFLTPSVSFPVAPALPVSLGTC